MGVAVESLSVSLPETRIFSGLVIAFCRFGCSLINFCSRRNEQIRQIGPHLLQI